MWMCWCVLVWNGHVKWEDHSKPRQPIAKSFCPIDSIVQVSNPMVLIKAWQSNILRCSLAWFCEMAIQQKRNYPPFPPASLAPLLSLSLDVIFSLMLSFIVLLVIFAQLCSLQVTSMRWRETEGVRKPRRRFMLRPASQHQALTLCEARLVFDPGRHHQMNPQRYTSQQILLPPCLRLQNWQHAPLLPIITSF